MKSISHLWLVASVATLAIAGQAHAQFRPGPAPTIDPRAVPTQTGPLRPQIMPNARIDNGPVTLSIIDRGLADAEADGGYNVRIDACVSSGDPGPMTYEVALPSGKRSGSMDSYFTPGKLPTYNSPGHQAVDNSRCRRAQFTVKPCEVAGGEYPITIRTTAGGAALVATDTTVLGPEKTTITVSDPGGWQTGLPRKLTGKVTGQCRPAADVPVSIQAAGLYATTQVQTDAAGNFAADVAFWKPGSATLQVAGAENDRFQESPASLAVTVAPAALQAKVTLLPEMVRVGAATAFGVRLVNPASNMPVPNTPVSLTFASQSCQATTGSSGLASCSMTLPASETAHAGVSDPLLAKVASAASVAMDGNNKAYITTADGLFVFTLTPTLSVPIIAGSKPAGVLLNNYNPGWSGTGAHLNNASALYPGPKFENGVAFDIPTMNKGPASYYIDNVLVRSGDVTFHGPSELRIPVTITGNLNGRGPRINGFCFTFYCRHTIGADDSMPDITGISLNDGYLAIELYVDNGHIKARFGKSSGSLSFSCGGVASVICGYVRDYANDQLHKMLDQLAATPSLLDQVGKQLDAGMAGLLKLNKIDKLVSLTVQDDGTISFFGTPLK